MKDKKPALRTVRKKDKLKRSIDEGKEITGDGILGAMLNTPPETHEEMQGKKKS